MRFWLKTISVLAVLAAIGGSSVQRAIAAPPRWGADYFPDVELTTQDGKTVHFYDDLLKGKIVAIDMIYTHCVDSCPLETARLAEVQRILGNRVGKDIFFYSITLDPKRDTPEVLKAYAEKYHAGPGWLFLTGKPADIDLISKKLGLYSDPDSSNRDGHTPGLLLGNVPSGQWMNNSALDDPHFLSVMIGQFMDNYRTPQDPSPSYAEAPKIDLRSGPYLFGTRCAACHTIGHGDKIGPDLLGVTNQRDHDWLTRFITAPDQVLAENDPIATALFAKYKQVQMPNLRLGPEGVKSLIEFLQSQTDAISKRAASVTNASDKPKTANKEAN
ncbi:MAG TPA: SCO family protein [Terriglobales bacterium]|nr:SCO family protein [Terriglobales bacterium]